MIKLIFTLGLIFTSLFNVVAQEFEWAKHFREIASSSPKEQYISKVLICPDKGKLLCGHFEGTMDFNPGVQDTTLFSNTLGNGFIVKLDSLGEFEWLARVSGNYGSGIEDITLDDQGNVYSTGFVRGIGTLDVGGENFALGSGANYTGFVMTFDPDGNYLWSQLFNNVSGAHNSTGYEILVVNNKLLLTGSFSGTMDMNPAGTPITLSSTNGTNFLICLDTNSTYNWHHQVFNNADDGRTLTADSAGNIYYSYLASNTYLKKFDLNGNVLLNIDWGSGNSFVIEDVAIDQDSGIYVTGYAEGGAFQNPIYDLDPGPGVFPVYQGIFYARLDHTGTFYSGKGIGGSMYSDILYSKGNGIALDYQKNIYLTGRRRAGGISGYNSIFISKYDTLGYQIWNNYLGTTQDNYGNDIVVDDDLSLYVGGGFDCTVNFSPGAFPFYMTTSGCGGEDGFLLKWTQDSCDHLGIIIDTIIGATCTTPGFVEAYGVNSAAPYLYSWDGGPFDTNPTFEPATGGNHTLIVKSGNQCEKVREFHVPGPTILGVDAQVNTLVKWRYSPDVHGRIIVDAFNSGCTASSGEVYLVIPQDLIYDSASINPDFINGDTLIWNYTNLDYQSPHFIATVYYTGDTLIQEGDTICYPVWITPLVDEDTTNNFKTHCQLASTSYDPNEKYVYPIGECIPNYIDTAQRMTYTVRFQNTGTSEALNIYILDTISPYLDVASLEILATSHTMMTEILPGDVLKFRFDDIHLADSASNADASSGYVIFELSQKDSVPNNSVVSNRAGIYFDYNAPVSTSAVFNTIVDVVPTSNYISSQITACDMYVSNIDVFDSTGIYFLDLTNQFGCDSLVVLDLTINHSNWSIDSYAVCEDFTWIDGNTYTNTVSGNTVSHTITNSFGCDSTVFLDLIIYPSDSSTLAETACDQYIWSENGVTYNTSGFYTESFSSINGCDSTQHLNLVVNYSSFATDAVNSCESYTWIDGNTYISSTNSPVWTIQNSAGCDSIISLDLIINNGPTSTSSVVACDSYTWIDGNTYTSSTNSPTWTVPSNLGCDSILTLDLTINIIDTVVAQTNDLDFVVNETGAQYQWVKCDGPGVYITIPGANNQTYSAIENGEYAVIVTNNGCTKFSACYAVSSAENVDIDLSNKVQIVPNPNNGQFLIQSDLNITGNINVYDVLGRLVESVHTTSNQINLHNPAPGTYYVELILDDKEVVKKVIIY